MRVQQPIEDDLNKHSANHFNKSMLAARGADTLIKCHSHYIYKSVNTINISISIH